ncbi:hypothetical protein [Tenacibaculum aiptasiae]|uniref:hypothetical protein n=1 Tax=Tenacibaculum aiptasiae TaxID=426481 RepID=UPI00232E0C7C|nr:hypothetical protein [Tenacibaculum aiptasiae]
MFRLKENTFWGTEDELVKTFIKKFNGKELRFGENLIGANYYEQIRINEIGRISDLIVECGSRLINIEFKLIDYGCVFEQSKDHLKWADYSYVCMPANALRVCPNYFMKGLFELGIGLIAGTPNTFIEVIRARHNTYKNMKTKEIRNIVNRKVRDAKAVQYELNINNF